MIGFPLIWFGLFVALWSPTNTVECERIEPTVINCCINNSGLLKPRIITIQKVIRFGEELGDIPVTNERLALINNFINNPDAQTVKIGTNRIFSYIIKIFIGIFSLFLGIAFIVLYIFSNKI